jgi:hypothetical protein
VRRARGTALGEAAAFHRAQLDALDALDAVDAPETPGIDRAPEALGATAAPPAGAPAGGESDGFAERAGAAERPAPEGP